MASNDPPEKTLVTADSPHEARWTYYLDSGLLDQILYTTSGFLRGKPKLRGIVFGSALVLTVVLALSWAGVIKGIGSLTGLVVPLYLFILPVLFRAAIYSGPEFSVQFRADEVQQQEDEAIERFRLSQAPQDAVSLDEARLNTYYEINQAQARSSFRWAIAMMVLGFSTIVSGIWIFYFRGPQVDTLLTALSTVAGMVSNLISCLFLSLHSKTNDRSYLYYKELADIRRIKLAVQLAETSGEENRTMAINQVIAHLLATVSHDNIKTPLSASTNN